MIPRQFERARCVTNLSDDLTVKAAPNGNPQPLSYRGEMGGRWSGSSPPQMGVRRFLPVTWRRWPLNPDLNTVGNDRLCPYVALKPQVKGQLE